MEEDTTPKALGTDIIPALKAKIPNISSDNVTKVNNLPDAVVTTGLNIKTNTESRFEVATTVQSLTDGTTSYDEFTFPMASGSTSGMMSALDKTKLNRVPQTVVTDVGTRQTSGDSRTNILVLTKNTTTGETGEYVAEIPVVSDQYNGMMTPDQNAKLSGLANIKTIGTGLSLADNGILSSTGGSSVTLYDEYSTATDGANTANFIKSKLDTGKVVIGQNANGGYIPSGATGYPNGHIAIGYNAKARGLSTSGSNDQSSIAIGYNAESGSSAVSGTRLYGSSVAIGNTAKATDYFAVAIGTNTNCNDDSSVALGSHSITQRSGEVSFGSGTSGFLHSQRYLANVKAGALDTDAVNKKQMETYVDGVVLYEGTASVNNITLSEAATSFIALEVHGEMTQTINGSSLVISKVEKVALENSVSGFKMEDTVVDPTANSVMLTTDIWSLSADKTEIDLARAVSVTTADGATTFATEPTSHFIITKVIGIGKKS